MLYLIPIIICLSVIIILTFIIYSPPRFIIFSLSKFYPDVLFHIDLPSNLQYIALTIDDFPNINDLSISFRLLDILRLHNARCTFFTIGSHIEKYESSSQIRKLFERLIADGHEIGNHGWRDEQAIRLSREELEQQIINTEKTINKYTSLNTKWFRPGSGFFNQTMIQICTNLGYRLVLGSIYPYDPQIPNSRLNSFFIEHKLYSGAIVILHDRLATIETLQRVLPAIQKRAFHVVTLTQLMNLKTKQ
ncbi:unnamed protein product [Rotaria sp. Silwood1]|nr:unnamed protein product [Rotaria sp. Silwood1]